MRECPDPSRSQQLLRRLWKTLSNRAKISLRSQGMAGFMVGKQFGFGDYEKTTAKNRILTST